MNEDNDNFVLLFYSPLFDSGDIHKNSDILKEKKNSPLVNMMRMAFFWGTDLGEFFFPGVQVNSAGGLAIACGVIAVFAVLYESIKVIFL